eukprot:764437-Hanusia_phi.AAC.3
MQNINSDLEISRTRSGNDQPSRNQRKTTQGFVFRRTSSTNDAESLKKHVHAFRLQGLQRSYELNGQLCTLVGREGDKTVVSLLNQPNRLLKVDNSASCRAPLTRRSDETLEDLKQSGATPETQEESTGGAKSRRHLHAGGSGDGVYSDIELDHYTLLGVSRDSSGEFEMCVLACMTAIAVKEIQDMFKRLARQFHPDRNVGDPKANQKFFAINQAQQVLTDPVKRAEYDKKVIRCAAVNNSRALNLHAAEKDGQAEDVEEIIFHEGIQ